jgi:tetratricopeptide (TPR) repeat protein
MRVRHYLLILALLLSSFSTYCQSVARINKPIAKIDSLLRLVAQYSVRDSVRVDMLNQIGFEYWTVEAIKSEIYGSEALALASVLNYESGMAMANRVIGVSHWTRGNFFYALEYLFESQEIYKEIHDRLGQANATMNIGLVYNDQQNYALALQYYFNALKLFEGLQQPDRIGTTYTKIGTAYINLKKFSTAYEYFIKALHLHQTNKYDFGILETNNQLGIMYREQGNLPEAEKFLTQSLALSEMMGNHEYTSRNLENLASIYIRQNKIQLAEDYLKRAQPLAREMGNKKSLLNILNDLKDISALRNDYKNALSYLEQYEILKDSLFSQQTAQRIQALEREREEKEKEQTLELRKQEMLLLQQKARTDRLIALSMGVILFLLAISGIIILRIQRLRLKKNKELFENNKLLFDSKQKLAEAELENTKLKEKELRQALELKNRELTSYTVNFIQKNELFDEIKERIEKIKESPQPAVSKELNGLLRQLHQRQTIDKDWEDFKLTFENVHPDFFNKLHSQFPDLSPAELKLCALIRLNLGIKEMASLLGISADSTKTARYRLRKKLNLAEEQNLNDFILSLNA